MNGRASGDLLGKYTCYNVKGSITVDFFITSDALLRNIIQSKVSTPRFRSCHCMVNMTIKVDQLVIEESMLHEFPPNFVSNNLYKIHFIEQLQKKDIIIQLDKLNNDIKNNTDIDYAVEKFKEIMLSVAEKSLPKRRSSTKVRKNTRKAYKKWFDHSCHVMKTRLNNLGKLLERYPNDPYVRGKLIAKEYRKLIKRKNRAWQNLLIEKLQEFESSNPKEYWKLIKSLRECNIGGDANNESDSVDPGTWFDYFKALNSSHEFRKSSFQINVEMVSKNYKQFSQKVVGVLDSELSLQEVKS